jgi:hypothetical protein
VNDIERARQKREIRTAIASVAEMVAKMESLPTAERDWDRFNEAMAFWLDHPELTFTVGTAETIDRIDHMVSSACDLEKLQNRPLRQLQRYDGDPHIRPSQRGSQDETQ